MYLFKNKHFLNTSQHHTKKKINNTNLENVHHPNLTNQNFNIKTKSTRQTQIKTKVHSSSNWFFRLDRTSAADNDPKMAAFSWKFKTGKTLPLYGQAECEFNEAGLSDDGLTNRSELSFVSIVGCFVMVKIGG